MTRQFSLRERQDVVQVFWTTVNEGGANLADVPRIVRLLLTHQEIWRKRDVDGKTVEFDSFLKFIITPPRRGCGWPPAKVERLLGDDAETLAMWREATTAKPGRPPKNGNNVPIKKPRPHRGNSKAFLLKRLKEERMDLFARVAAGEMSANAAAMEAGFRKKAGRKCPSCGHEW